MRFAVAAAMVAVLLVVFVGVLGCGSSSSPPPSAPTVISTSPAKAATGVPFNSKITATFSKAMEPSTITTGTFTLKQGTTPVSGTVTYTGSTATFTPDNNLTDNTSFTATITTGVQDLAANALASPYVWSFTTGASPDPTVISTNPANYATGIAVNAAISATFSTAMQPTTITTATFTLQQGTTPVSGTVTYAGLTATFTPDSSLTSRTSFTATITTGVQDLAGNALASPYVWSFKTGAAPGDPPLYDIYDLGTLGGHGHSSVGLGINDSGQVTGYAQAVTGTFSHAFLYSGGVMTDLGTLGGSRSEGHGINDSGQVTGKSDLVDGGYHAFLYSGGRMKDLGTLGGSLSNGFGINASGQVTGIARVDIGGYHAFLYSGGVMTDLGTLGRDNSTGNGINNSGQVIGYSNTVQGGNHAFLYSEGVMTDLGTLGGRVSLGYGINDSGQATGAPFIYSGGVMTNLGTLPGGSGCCGLGINNSGQVVGWALTTSGTKHGFLYSEGTTRDLNSLLDSGNPLNAGWIVSQGSGINDSGWITGYGTHNGYTRAFLMEPVP